MGANANVAVVIPFYRDSISAYEEIALLQCQKVLGSYTKIAIKPKHLTLPSKASLVSFEKVVDFDDKYFDGIAGYNLLMLSEKFYERFLDYDYILIYQLDAFVFEDKLNYWCKQGYDYIGAPWLRRKGYENLLKSEAYQLVYRAHRFFNIKKGGLPTEEQFYDKVGNGGFSLRRVNKFHELAHTMQHQAKLYLSKQIDVFNEDAFWSIEVNRKVSKLKIPNYKTGVNFSIELHPARAMELTENKLPFGCHAWDLHIDFWRSIFEHYGYDV